MITTYQVVDDIFGVAVNFAVYAVVSFAGGVFCYVVMPETKGKSFADIQTDFHRRDHQFAREKRRSSGTADNRAVGYVSSRCDYQQI
jgi:hypothetical protein